jgi:hypothetical protein
MASPEINSELNFETDAELEQRNRRQVFIRDAMPDNWQSLAVELRDAAEILWQQHEETLRVTVVQSEFEVLDDLRVSGISRPYFLLAGFAIENLLKGMLVAVDASLINTGRLAKRLDSHKLVMLAELLPNLTLDEDERRFCEVAQSAIPYWGRYPIPKEFNGVMPEVALTALLRGAFLKLFGRIHEQVYRAIRDGWDSGAGPQTCMVRDSQYEILDMNESFFPD